MADDRAAAHDKIRKAVAAGEIADLGTADEDEPPPYDDEDAWSGRTIDGEWLADFLTSPQSTIDRIGVSLVGVRILGGVDLEAAELRYRLALIRCQVGPNVVNLGHSRLRMVDLRGSACSTVRVEESTISGNLELTDGFAASGEVNLVGANIAGALICDGGTFANAAGFALNANRARIAGGVYLRHGFTASGEVSFGGGAHVGGSLECDGGSFANPGGTALDADLATIGGSVFLGEGFSATSEVSFGDATVGGMLRCHGGTFSNARGIALNASGAKIAGAVFLRSGFTAEGEVRFHGATVGGSFECDGGTFTNGRGMALALGGARLESRLVLRYRFAAQGEVNLASASIAGVLGCDGSTFTNPGGQALVADRARIGSTVFLRNCEVDGEVRLVGAVIGGELDCRRTVLRNPDGRTLRMDSAQVTGLVNLSHVRSTGEIRLRRSSIGGLLDCDDTHLTNPDGNALDAAWTRINGHVRFGRGAEVDGFVSFRQSEAGGLADDLSSWPARISVSGFHYNQLTGRGADQAWRARAGWLRKQDRPSPDAYVYLAGVYRSVGDELSARKILIERHNTLLHPPVHWKPQGGERSRWMAAASWLRRWVLRVTIGHGYEPWRVLWFAVPLVLAMTVWFAQAKQDDLLVPTDSTTATSSDCDSSYTCVQPAMYAVDTLVPLVDFGQRSRWTPDQSQIGGQWLAAATWITSALGWVFASLVAASFTQVVRRE